MKILAAVSFNKRVAYVLSRKPNLQYTKYGDVIIGTDGTFAHVIFTTNRSRDHKHSVGGDLISLLLMGPSNIVMVSGGAVLQEKRGRYSKRT